MTSEVKIIYRVNDDVNAAEVAKVFAASGIKRPVDDIGRISRMLEHADITITARDGEKLIGIARALTDYSYCCYLSDLAVEKAYQQKGIGTEMVDFVKKEIGDEVALILLASPIAMDYYPRIGFQTISNGFIIPRKQ